MNAPNHNEVPTAGQLTLENLKVSIHERFLVLSLRPTPVQGFLNTATVKLLYRLIPDLDHHPTVLAQLIRAQGGYQAFEVPGLSSNGLSLEERMERVAHLTAELLLPHLARFNPNCVPLTLQLSIDHEQTVRAVVIAHTLEVVATLHA